MSLRLETFEEELFQRLGREYRVRWSPRKETYCIEQKISRPHFDIPAHLRDSDTWIRHRDGYALVCEVSPSPFMRCDKCRTRLEVPALKWAEVKCHSCHASRERNNTQFFVAYFPLGERLLAHLESTSPKRGWAWIEEMKQENEANKRRQQREWEAHAEAGLSDYRNIIADIPRVGYGNGPASFGERNRI